MTCESIPIRLSKKKSILNIPLHTEYNIVPFHKGIHSCTVMISRAFRQYISFSTRFINTQTFSEQDSEKHFCFREHVQCNLHWLAIKKESKARVVATFSKDTNLSLQKTFDLTHSCIFYTNIETFLLQSKKIKIK